MLRNVTAHIRSHMLPFLRMTFSPAFLVLICAWPVFCQGLHLGVKAGIPVTQYFETGATGGLHGGAAYSAATRRYTIGASGEWRFNNSFGFEVDAMYHRMGYVGTVYFFDSANGNFGNSAIDVKGNSWDFPALAKYRFGHGICPYVAAGAVVRYVGPVRGRGEQTVGSLVTRISSTSPLDTGEPSELRKRFYPGLTAAAGLEVRVGRFRVLPEFRYTRWTANISAPGGLLRFGSNQSEFLVGLLF
jgi:hypothetical protein